jgi:aminoglycoside phosphotransferase (APT) family kinase protein
MPTLTPALAKRLSAAIDDCAAWMKPWRGAYVAAHGDFAPWNIRQHDRGIAVFDWEYAVGGAVPLFDMLHFLIAPRIAAGKRVGPKEWKTALSRAQAYARPIFSDMTWSTGDVAAQGLVYLLYTVFFYSVSRNAVLESHPTIDAYLKLIEERAQWQQWSN